MDLKRLFRIPSEIFALPEVTIRMSGDANARSTFIDFSKPHPKYKLIQNKRWGAGLLKLPDTFDAYIKGKDKQALRTNRRRSIDGGFRFETFNPGEHLDEILAINTSMRFRQGYPMTPDHLNIESLRVWAQSKRAIYGLFDTNRVLKAYAHTPVHGEVFIFSRLLGHAEELNKGIMYLLVSEVIREMIDGKRKYSMPIWGMYDTFFGASPGLQYFKERMGFRPYKVRWVWENDMP